jgi:hypothetical protein
MHVRACVHWAVRMRAGRARHSIDVHIGNDLIDHAAENRTRTSTSQVVEDNSSLIDKTART